MTTLEILRAARALIDTPEKWIKAGQYAFDERGYGIDPASEDACRFCALGAMYHAGRCGGTHAAVEALASCIPNRDAPTPGSAVIRFNDSHSYPDVLAAFDRAIAAEEAVPA